MQAPQLWYQTEDSTAVTDILEIIHRSLSVSKNETTFREGIM